MSLSQWTAKVKTKSWRYGSTAICVIVGTVSPVIAPAPGAWGQLPKIPGLNEVEQILTPKTSGKIVPEAVRLDGHKLFEIAAPAVSDTQQETTPRDEQIEKRLARIAKQDFKPATLQITSETIQTPQGRLPKIYVNSQYLMTVTPDDVELQGSDLSTLADEWSQTIKQALIRAKQERQLKFLQQQGILAGGVTLAMLLGSLGVSQLQRRLKVHRRRLLAQMATGSLTSPFGVDSQASGPANITQMQEQMTQRQQHNLLEVQRRLLQTGQLAIWGGGIFFVLGLFPYTRWLRPLILSGLEAPLTVIGIGLGTYVVIRIGAVLIDHFFQALQVGEFLPPQASQRLALRISTLSLVLKGTIAVILISLGTLGAFSVVGVNVGPLLAGVGIIGLALSFASQSLIKDVINGFFILLEDQYAVGDVIAVGDMGGFVENMNLRITQLRNDEGRLITIPNSEISIVENLSKDWSRVDLKIYVACDADLDQAFAVIERVGQEMSRERPWRKKILESPEILGVDELKYTGILIRVWIKTQPLQQWSVAREYRRRLKFALDQQGVSIGIPQQSILFQNSLGLKDKALNGSDGQEPQQTARHSDRAD